MNVKLECQSKYFTIVMLSLVSVKIKLNICELTVGAYENVRQILFMPRFIRILPDS